MNEDIKNTGLFISYDALVEQFNIEERNKKLLVDKITETDIKNKNYSYKKDKENKKQTLT